jgi:GAF domain-containing protein
MWTADAHDRGEFETRTWQRPYPVAGSALGHAFNARDATWLSGLENADDERLLAAAREGMRSSVLVPIRSGRTAVALLELLSRAPLQPDPELAAAMDAIALQLGHFWQLLRQGAQPHWRLGRL